MRVGDLLKLKVEDVRNKKHIHNKEQKTSKAKRFLINTVLRKELDKYMKDMTKGEYLFQSKIGNNKSLSRFQAYRIISSAGKEAGLERIAPEKTLVTITIKNIKI